MLLHLWARPKQRVFATCAEGSATCVCFTCLLLQILVELAIERQQELPALVYEARPTSGPYQRGMWRNRQQPQNGRAAAAGDATAAAAGSSAGMGLATAAVAPLAAVVGSVGARDGTRGDGDSSPSHRVALLAGQARSSDDMLQEMALTPRGSSAGGGVVAARQQGTDRRGGRPLGEGQEDGSSGAQPAAAAAAAGRLSSVSPEPPGSVEGTAAVPLSPERSTLSAAAAAETGGGAGNEVQQGLIVQEEEYEESEGSLGLPDAIKLGLGDFIFYSMLVGRAAMYDMMTGKHVWCLRTAQAGAIPDTCDTPSQHAHTAASRTATCPTNHQCPSVPALWRCITA